MSPDARLPLLALHTTEPEGSVAVATPQARYDLSITRGAPSAPALLEAVVQVLEAAHVGFDGLAGIVVSTGPGSFTGIRVGLATAQGLAAARAWRIFTCDSLYARAATFPGQPTPLAVVLDARRGEVYGALYDVRALPPRVLVAPFCAAPEPAAARLEAGAAGGPEVGAEAANPLALTGSGAALLAGCLRAPPLVLPAAPRRVAAALIELAWNGGCSSQEPQAVEPTYLRQSDAEVRRENPVPRGT